MSEEKNQSTVSFTLHTKKVYPRAIDGMFNRWRWVMVWITQLVFYGLPWLQWGERQMVLFDLGARRFYLFGLVLYPQDFIYLTGLLILSALSLFLFTAVAGRLWCGFTCPQTVYTEIFMWLENRIEGDRSARMRLDKAAWTLPEKLAKKGLKQLAWVSVALWTGFTFVGFFVPIRSLGAEILPWQGGWQLFWVFFYALATYGFAGFMREQVCKYMCPYARFQSAMFDEDTLIVTYDSARGEPRGVRSKKVDPKAAGLGDCIDCSLCVQVCPHGHRHPQRPAVRVHWLRPVRGRVQHGDGQGGLPARADPLCHPKRHAPALDQPPNAAPRIPSARAGLWRGAANAGRGDDGEPGHAHPAQSGRGARPHRHCPHRARGQAGKRVPAANHERHRNAPALPHQRPGLGGADPGPGFNREVPATGARWVSVQLQIPYGSAAPGSHPIHFTVQALEHPAQVQEKATFLVPR